MSKVSEDPLYQVRMARWDGWRRLAKELPDHHILAVELLRTRNDETAAVFTVARRREPVQYLVRGDSRGRVRPAATHDVATPHVQGHGAVHVRARGDDCGPVEAHAAMAMELRSEEDMTANSIAMGEPPPKEPPPPGIFSLATVLLASAFDVGEQVPTDR